MTIHGALTDEIQDPGIGDKYGADDNILLAVQLQVLIISEYQDSLRRDATNQDNVITIQYGTTGDFRGMVQRNAQADLEIIGRFSTGVSGTLYPADSPVIMRIGNVEAGSGTAMLTSPSNHQVEAGSDDNTIRIVYRAAGTMNGGSVRLSTPADWGNLDERDSCGKELYSGGCFIECGRPRRNPLRHSQRFGPDHDSRL